MKRLFLACAIATCLPLLHPDLSSAQGVENTISAEPARLEFAISNEGEDASTLVTLTNQYDTPVTLTAEFKAIDDLTGRIIPAGDVNDTLARSLRVSESEFTIPAHSKHFLTVAVTDTTQLPAGGQYATLLLSDRTKTKVSSNVRSQIALGIFISKAQGQNLKIVLSRNDIERKRFQFPTKMHLEFLNDGNVHAVPRGYVRIYDDDTMYYETILNTRSETIMPTKRLEQSLDLPQVVRWWPKKVTIEIGYRADGLNESSVSVEDFWYVPFYLWPLVVSVLTLITLGIAFRRQFWRRLKLTKK